MSLLFHSAVTRSYRSPVQLPYTSSRASSPWSAFIITFSLSFATSTDEEGTPALCWLAVRSIQQQPVQARVESKSIWPEWKWNLSSLLLLLCLLVSRMENELFCSSQSRRRVCSSWLLVLSGFREKGHFFLCLSKLHWKLLCFVSVSQRAINHEFNVGHENGHRKKRVYKLIRVGKPDLKQRCPSSLAAP